MCRKQQTPKLVRKLIVSLESSDQQQHALEDYIEVRVTSVQRKIIIIIVALYNVNK